MAQYTTWIYGAVCLLGVQKMYIGFINWINFVSGNTVSDLGHTIFGQHFGDSFLGSREHCGFLYVRSSFQCLQKLSLPPAPYVFGILLQQWETPWAKVFPIRLMLRLGAEFRCKSFFVVIIYNLIQLTLITYSVKLLYYLFSTGTFLEIFRYFLNSTLSQIYPK